MNIILLGGGEFGYLLSKEVQVNHDVTVIDVNENFYDRFSELDINFIVGNGVNPVVLTNAGIESADLFVACTSSDEVNIISCWTVKHLAKSVETIGFVNHYDYLLNDNTKSSTKLSKSLFGIDYVVWPKKSLADDFEKIISVPSAIDVEIFAKGKVKLFEYRIKYTTPIVNKLIKDCFFPEGCVIVGIFRNDELIIPDGNTMIEKYDKVIFMGTDEALKILTTSYFEPTHDEVRTVTIIGGGTVGTILAKRLESIGMDVKIIESNLKRCELLAAEMKTALVLNGDGTDLELLEEEQVYNSDVLVSVINNDEKNLLCSLLGKQLGVKKVLTRVDKTINLKLFEKVGIDVALSPKSSSINKVLNEILEKNIDLLGIVERGKGGVIEVLVPENFEDITLQEIRLPCKAIIGVILRRSRVIVPRGNTMIRENDKLIVFTKPEDANKVKAYFETVEE